MKVIEKEGQREKFKQRAQNYRKKKKIEVEMIAEELEKMKEENEKLMRLLIGKQRVIRDLQEEVELMGNDIDVVREQQVEDEENNDEEEIFF